jgi:YD repeat-containing protein
MKKHLSPSRTPLVGFLALLVLSGIFTFGTPEGGCEGVLKVRGEIWVSGLSPERHAALEEALIQELPQGIAWEIHRGDEERLAQNLLADARAHANSLSVDDLKRDLEQAQTLGPDGATFRAALQLDLDAALADIDNTLIARAQERGLAPHVAIIHFSAEPTQEQLMVYGGFLAEAAPKLTENWLEEASPDSAPRTQLLTNTILSALARFHQLPEDTPIRIDDPVRAGLGIDRSDPNHPLLNPLAFSDTQEELLFERLALAAWPGSEDASLAKAHQNQQMPTGESAWATPNEQALREFSPESIDDTQGIVMKAHHNETPAPQEPELFIDRLQISGAVQGAQGFESSVLLGTEALLNCSGCWVSLENLRTMEVSVPATFNGQEEITFTIGALPGDMLQLRLMTTQANSGLPQNSLYTFALGMVPGSQLNAPHLLAGQITFGRTRQGWVLKSKRGAFIEGGNYPVLLRAYDADVVLEEITLASNKTPLAMTFSSPNQNLKLEIIDVSGARDELYLNVGTKSGPRPTPDSFTPSPHQRPAEWSAGLAKAGGILLVGREVEMEIPLLRIAGAKMSLPVSLTYRSGLADAPHRAGVGSAMVLNLDQRIENPTPGGPVSLRTGSKLIDGFIPLDQPSGLYASPPGVFSLLFFDAGAGHYWFENLEGTKRYFDARTGWLKAIEDAFGNRIDIHRSGFEPHQVRSVVNDQGLITRFYWQLDGRLAAVMAPDGRKLKLSYDALGNLKQVRSPAGNTTTFVYSQNRNLPHHLEEIVDPNGHVLRRFIYDAAGKVSATRGRHTMQGPGQTSLVDKPYGTDIVSPEGGTTKFYFDRSPDSAGQVSHIERYSLNRRGSGTQGFPGGEDPQFVATHFTYNTNNLLLTSTWTSTGGEDLEKRTISYLSSTHEDPKKRARVASVIAEGIALDPDDNRITHYDYGTADLPFPRTITYPSGAVEHREYEAGGALTLSRIDNITRAIGAPYSVEHRYTYNIRGLKTTTTLPNRSAAGGPESAPSERLTYYQDTPQSPWAGLLKKTEKVKITGEAVLPTTYTYDGAGRLVSEKLPGGGQSHRAFDEDGQLLRHQGPITAPGVRRDVRYIYRANGSLAEKILKWTDHDGSAKSDLVSSFTYNSAGVLHAEEHPIDVTQNLRSRIEYRYTPSGKKKRIARRLTSNQWSIEDSYFDAWGRRLAHFAYPDHTTSPDGAGMGIALKTFEQYTPTGRLLYRWDPGVSQPFERAYNAFGEVVLETSAPINIGEAFEGGAGPQGGLLAEPGQQTVTRVAQRKKFFTYDGSGFLLSEERASRDISTEIWLRQSVFSFVPNQLGQTIEQRSSNVFNPDPTVATHWQTRTFVLLPNGTLQKSLLNGELVTELIEDDLGRTQKRVSPYARDVEYIYDEQSGLRSEEHEILMDGDTEIARFRTSIFYNTNQAVTSRVSHGDILHPEPKSARGMSSSYDSLGLVVRREGFVETGPGLGNRTLSTEQREYVGNGIFRHRRSDSHPGTEKGIRETIHTLDGMGRVEQTRRVSQEESTSDSISSTTYDALSRPVSKSRAFDPETAPARISQFTYQSGSPYLASRTSPEGRVTAYQRNTQGTVLSKTTTMPADNAGTFVSNTHVFRYGHMTGGGLLMTSRPSQSVTRGGAGFYTVVDRVFGTGERLLSEEFQVNVAACDSTPPTLKTTYERDSQGRVILMESGPSVMLSRKMSLANEYVGPTNRLLTREALYQGESLIKNSFMYEGERLERVVSEGFIEPSSNNLSMGTQEASFGTIVTKTFDYDARNSETENRSEPGPLTSAASSKTIVTSTQRDDSGQVVSSGRHVSGTEPLWSHYDVEGEQTPQSISLTEDASTPDWTNSDDWSTPATAEGVAASVEDEERYERTFSDFDGRMLRADQYWASVPTAQTLQPSASRVYHYNNAQLPTGYTGEHITLAGGQREGKEILSNLQRTYNEHGILAEESFHYQKSFNCDHLGLGENFRCNKEYTANRTYRYDSAGQVVEVTLARDFEDGRNWQGNQYADVEKGYSRTAKTRDSRGRLLWQGRSEGIRSTNLVPCLPHSTPTTKRVPVSIVYH